MTRTLVGVIGVAGDLGSQVVSWIRDAGYETMCADTATIDSPTIEEVLKECQIVHFCIPQSGFQRQFTARKGQMLILHDSVMSTSKAINTQYFSSKAHVIHMLMNSSRTAVIEPAPAVDLKKHLQSIGCSPVPMAIDEHDRMMARSQTPLALLVKLLLDDLRGWHDRKLLTPSGEVLLEALEARAINWTEQTMRSLLSNPQIRPLLDEMQLLITDQRGYNKANE